MTHDLRRALLLADRIAILIGGSIAQQGPRDEILLHPASPEMARLVGMTNLAVGRVVEQVGRYSRRLPVLLHQPLIAPNPTG